MEPDISQSIEELIAACLTRKLSPEEGDALNEWIHASEENRVYFLNMREIWFSSMSASGSRRFNKEQAFKRFQLRTGTGKGKGKKSAWRPVVYAAAVVALLLIVSYTAYWQGGEQLKNRFADIVIEAPSGSKTKIVLPDGTLVWLNAGSKIMYSQGFGVSERNVDLLGEGYFEVTKNEKLPFGVQTKELSIDVLGTKFNFRNYPDDEEATVSLLEGKVLASNRVKKDKDIRLLPDQRIFLNKKSGEMRIVTVMARNTAEWTNGYLFFDEVLLPDIVKELERSYNVTIRIVDPTLNTFRFYGNFVRKEQSIEEVLELLASTHKLKYRKNGKDILLYAINE
jgi:ferric-dicitrate binding protein FerR (iron transport regulator)